MEKLIGRAARWTSTPGIRLDLGQVRRSPKLQDRSDRVFGGPAWKSSSVHYGRTSRIPVPVKRCHDRLVRARVFGTSVARFVHGEIFTRGNSIKY